MVVNKHKDELGRLERFAREIGDQPGQLATDAEFNQALDDLAFDSEQLEKKSNQILIDYKDMMINLSKGNLILIVQNSVD